MSALQFTEHVSHYVEKEVSFGSLVRTFKFSVLQFKSFRGPFGSMGLTDDNFGSFLALAAHLGLRLSEGHIPPPGPVCIALDLQYDVDSSTISLPEDKVVAFTTLLKEWLDRPKATEKELASLPGKLLKAANGVFAGRLFPNRVLATKRQSGIRACNYALNEFISVPPPAHLHDLHTSDLELLAHLLVVRVGDPQLAHRLRMARIHASDQITHDYRAHRLIFDKFSKEAGVTPCRRQISLELPLYIGFSGEIPQSLPRPACPLYLPDRGW